MRTPRTLVVAAVVFCAGLAPAAAQDEAALKSFFEGRRVTVRIDMPGTSDGVNIYGDRNGEMDLQDYRNHLRQYGTSIRAGDTVVVTMVKVKKDVIEFQLAGGGFGTFWDNTSTSPDTEFREKSQRERDLEKRIRDEDDAKKRREMQHELDELRDRRERENRRIAVQREHESEAKAQRIADERLRGGSRFNLRWDRVPAGITPEQMMALLVEYVDFGMSPRTTDVRGEAPPAPPADIGALRKGLTRAEAEELFGRPVEISDRQEGTLTIRTLVFLTGDHRIAADFVDDVLVRYTITSK